jgi:hypothetical protein
MIHWESIFDSTTVVGTAFLHMILAIQTYSFAVFVIVLISCVTAFAEIGVPYIRSLLLQFSILYFVLRFVVCFFHVISRLVTILVFLLEEVNIYYCSRTFPLILTTSIYPIRRRLLLLYLFIYFRLHCESNPEFTVNHSKVSSYSNPLEALWEPTILAHHLQPHHPPPNTSLAICISGSKPPQVNTN